MKKLVTLFLLALAIVGQIQAQKVIHFVAPVTTPIDVTTTIHVGIYAGYEGDPITNTVTWIQMNKTANGDWTATVPSEWSAGIRFVLNGDVANYAKWIDWNGWNNDDWGWSLISGNDYKSSHTWVSWSKETLATSTKIRFVAPASTPIGATIHIAAWDWGKYSATNSFPPFPNADWIQLTNTTGNVWEATVPLSWFPNQYRFILNGDVANYAMASSTSADENWGACRLEKNRVDFSYNKAVDQLIYNTDKLFNSWKSDYAPYKIQFIAPPTTPNEAVIHLGHWNSSNNTSNTDWIQMTNTIGNNWEATVPADFSDAGLRFVLNNDVANYSMWANADGSGYSSDSWGWKVDANKVSSAPLLYGSGQTWMAWKKNIYTTVATGSGVWNDVATWEGGEIPSTEAIVIVKNNLTINQNASVFSFTINPGAKVTLNVDKTLSATSFNIKSEAIGTGTFVDNNLAGGLTVSGTTSVQQYLTGALTTISPSGRFWYVSSPVTGATSTVFNALERNKLWNYSESAHGYTEITDNATTLEVGTGYAVRLGADTIITFTGTLNTGDKTIPLTRNDGNEKSGYNLIGNPYPSFIDYHAVNMPASVLPSVWTRSCTAGGLMAFDTYNTLTLEGVSGSGKTVTQHIAPMQAFWLKVASGYVSGSITLTNAMRYSQDLTLNTNILKVPSVVTQQVLCLQISNGTNSDEAVIAFNENASDDFDNYDSPKMSNNNVAIPEIYTLAGSEKVAINGMRNISTFPLGFTTGEPNSYSIKASRIKNFDADIKVILKDNLLNKEQDLTDGTVYNFTSDATTTTARFSIVFKTVSTITGIDTNNQIVNIFKNNNGQIVINNHGAEGTITVCNAIGQKIVNAKTTGASTVINDNLTSGVYLVILNVAGTNTTKKIIIN